MLPNISIKNRVRASTYILCKIHLNFKQQKKPQHSIKPYKKIIKSSLPHVSSLILICIVLCAPESYIRCQLAIDNIDSTAHQTRLFPSYTQIGLEPPKHCHASALIISLKYRCKKKLWSN